MLVLGGVMLSVRMLIPEQHIRSCFLIVRQRRVQRAERSGQLLHILGMYLG